MKILIYILVFGIIAVLSVMPPDSYSQTRHKLIKDGNKMYEKGEYDEAIARYHTAQRKGNLPQIDFNLGNAHYKSGNIERAAEEYLKTLNDTSATLRSRSLYNLGNALLKADQADKAVEAYINSLRLDPEDIETKQNLEYALRMMQQQQQQKDQENQDQDQEQQEQQQQQQNQDQEEQQEEQQQQQQQQEEEQQEQQEQQQSQQQEEQMSEEDALQLLNALQDDEKEVQKKVIKKQMEGKKSKGKNW